MEANAIRIDDLPDVLTVTQLAKVLRISKNTAYKLIREGRIRIKRLGRIIRISKHDLLIFVNGHTEMQAYLILHICSKTFNLIESEQARNAAFRFLERSLR